VWQRCLDTLEQELSSQQFNTWIRPLHAIEEGDALCLLAPNRFVMNWVNEQYIDRIREMITSTGEEPQEVRLVIGSSPRTDGNDREEHNTATLVRRANTRQATRRVSNLNREFSFDFFVEGKSNQLARAASMQVAENPGAAYNPLFIYGGVGLGKTHMMHAVGNRILENKQGLALVPVVGSSCGGCHMNVTPQQRNAIKMNEELVFCEMCARILYLEDDS